jgi:RNA polymerase sigma-70 factor (ECF subfamily)
VQLHDPDAWQRLAELYGPLVYHWCRRSGLGEADASDVFQDVFVTIARAVARFDPDSSNGTFRGWLWTITQSRLRDHWRRQRGRESAVGGTDAQVQLARLPDPAGDDSSGPSDRSETASLFHRALRMIEAEFEPRTWQAFWRAVVEQQETAQIAADLGMSCGSVRQAKSRVLRRLRRQLGDQ